MSKHALADLSQAMLTPGAWQWACYCGATGSASGFGRANLQFVNHKAEEEGHLYTCDCGHTLGRHNGDETVMGLDCDVCDCGGYRRSARIGL